MFNAYFNIMDAPKEKQIQIKLNFENTNESAWHSPLDMPCIPRLKDGRVSDGNPIESMSHDIAALCFCIRKLQKLYEEDITLHFKLI